MRGPYGSLVEFISRKTGGGGFGGIVERAFGNLQNGPTFDRQNNGMEIWWRLTRIGNCWEISKRAKPKSSQGPSGSRKTF